MIYKSFFLNLESWWKASMTQDLSKEKFYLLDFALKFKQFKINSFKILLKFAVSYYGKAKNIWTLCSLVHTIIRVLRWAMHNHLGPHFYHSLFMCNFYTQTCLFKILFCFANAFNIKTWDWLLIRCMLLSNVKFTCTCMSATQMNLKRPNSFE